MMRLTSRLNQIRVFVFALLVLLSSCAVATKTASIDASYIAKSQFIMAKPQMVDVVVEKKKIEGRASLKNSLYGKDVTSALDAAKKLAVLDAVKKGDADIIVQPIFEVESVGEYTNAIVTGFPGKYKEFRDVDLSDTLALQLRADMGHTSLVTQYAAPTEVEVTKGSGKKGKGVGGLILGIVLLAALIPLIGLATKK